MTSKELSACDSRGIYLLSANIPRYGSFYLNLAIKRKFLITIIIPCFNEAARLEPEPFLSFLKDTANIHLLFVDDGSKDETISRLEVLRQQVSDRISLLKLPQNQGKGEAIRQGVIHAANAPITHIGYWDADLATPLTAVPEFVEFTSPIYNKKMICGARVLRLGAQISRHWYRHYPGRIAATCISIILGLPFYDTQCGAKLIEKELAVKIFADPFVNPWLFDVELVARIVVLYGRKQAAQLIYELPLSSWTDVDGSKVSLGYLMRVPYELLRIYWRYRRQLSNS